MWRVVTSDWWVMVVVVVVVLWCLCCLVCHVWRGEIGVRENGLHRDVVMTWLTTRRTRTVSSPRSACSFMCRPKPWAVFERSCCCQIATERGEREAAALPGIVTLWQLLSSRTMQLIANNTALGLCKAPLVQFALTSLQAKLAGCR